MFYYSSIHLIYGVEGYHEHNYRFFFTDGIEEERRKELHASYLHRLQNFEHGEILNLNNYEDRKFFKYIKKICVIDELFEYISDDVVGFKLM